MLSTILHREMVRDSNSLEVIWGGDRWLYEAGS